MKAIFSFGAFHFMLAMTSCTIIEDSKPDPSKILNSAPYESITDSIRRFPKSPELYLIRGLRLSQNNLHEIATADYAKAWELAPNEATALEYTSNLMLVNQTAEASSLLKYCITRFPDFPEFRRRLSEAYAHAGRNRDALLQLDTMIAMDSSSFEAWYEKGLLMADMNDTAAAIQSLERSYALQPLLYTGMALANIYAQQKNPRTLIICDDMLRRDSAGPLTDVLFIKGIYLSEIKSYSEAMQVFDACIKADWKFVDAYIEKGIILYEQKKTAEALEVFTLAATVSNTDADAYYWMAKCYEALNQKREAIDNYSRALSLDKGFTQAREALKRLR